MVNVPISACLIVRDEASTLRACLESIRPHVDEIVVVDTGSVDDSPAIAREFADKFEVFLDCNEAESGLIADFSLARNRSFAIATHDVAIWVDADDILVGGEHLRRFAEEATSRKAGGAENYQLLAPYEYAHDEQGRVTLLQYRERMVYPRQRFEWRFPVHEGLLLAGGNGDMRAERTEDFRLIHQSRKSTKPRELGRNRRILEAYLHKVGEADVRSMYYYGVELGLSAMHCYAKGDTAGFLRENGNSLRVLKRYVELAYWADEKALALLEICRGYQRLNDHGEAINWAFRAMATKSWPEPYWCLVKSFYSLAEQDKREAVTYYRKAVHFGAIGMSMKPSDEAQSVLSQNPTERFEIQQVISVCHSALSDLDAAIASCEFGLSGLPDHDIMRANMTAFRLTRAKRRVLADVAELKAGGALGDGADVIIKGAINGDFTVQLLTSPADMPDDAARRVLSAHGDDSAPSGAGVRDTERPATSPGKLDIIIFVGQGLEQWNPDTFARTGLGGSETMAWELARRLAKLGNSVRLVGHCGPSAQDGTFDGVEYLDWQLFLHPGYAKKCDVLISSRRPEIVDPQWRIEAGARILWVHDVDCGAALTHKRNLRFDRIFALSNWHKSILQRCYPLIDPSKIVVTRNGIDLERFETANWKPGIGRNARRAIYSSSPDRGLEVLLDIWPVVRKSIPDAELHCFYGFENWQKSAELSKDENQLKMVRFLTEKIKRTPGVVMHGRVSQAELAREFMRSGVWAYPTGFTETSCITAMEAQAAGCRIVTSPLAALNETVGQRGQLVAGYGTPGYVDTFAAAVVVAMTGPSGPRTADDRDALSRYAREHFGLDELAEEWESMLNEILLDVGERVVPAFFKAEVA